MQCHIVWHRTIRQGIVGIRTLSTPTPYTFKHAIPHKNGRVILTLSIMSIRHLNMLQNKMKLIPSLDLDRHCPWEGCHYEQGY
jgi:hypothetical protein